MQGLRFKLETNRLTWDFSVLNCCPVISRFPLSNYIIEKVNGCNAARWVTRLKLHALFKTMLKPENKTKSLSAILWVVISKSVWLGKDTEAFKLKWLVNSKNPHKPQQNLYSEHSYKQLINIKTRPTKCNCIYLQEFWERPSYYRDQEKKPITQKND